MPARVIDDPVFDLMSYARRGPGRRDRLTPAQLRQIAHTVSHSPEVMVKVLPRGVNDLAAVRRHLDYIGRKGDLDLETGDGETLRGAHVGRDLIEDWDLELDAERRQTDLVARPGAKVPRLVHKLVFSMSAGTPSEKVLKAVQNFCREEFGLKHRHIMGLHTDEPHPHVHGVLKALSEQGRRLNIRKATLRTWRERFAGHLRAPGAPANATPRCVRGEMRSRKSDGISPASLRGESTHMRRRAETVVRELCEVRAPFEPGKVRLVMTHHAVQRAWREIGDVLTRERLRHLGHDPLTHQPPSIDHKATVIEKMVAAKGLWCLSFPHPARLQ